MHRREEGRERGREGGVKREYNNECVSPSDAEKSSDRERTVMVSILYVACRISPLVTISLTSDPLLSVL